ncbi:unnamed protein product [Schistosoma margrebowiei]|uniref:Uncharacterized protein n=1 Tax=Schistosoma margrebowiei TaxID=48269 RepID=A0A183L8M1_9TREM|nr:unnamed protein product [Schistosoma margrebowiei]
MSNNYISNRRTLRSNLEKFQLSYYQDLLASFGDVKKSVKSETVCLVEEVQKLRSDSCSLMNEATEILDRAYENLYEWAQNEYANARRKASVKSFLDVLSVEIDSNSTVGNHSVGTIYTMHIREKPRDHVRIVSDILACVHQITASEKEYINSLCKNCHDTLIADLKIICLDTITESLCSHLKMVVGGSQQETLDPGFVLLGTRQQGVPVILRELVLPGGFDLVSPSFTLNMENMLVSHHDAVTLYKMNNIMRFYQHTFRSLIKSTASLNLCLDEVQKLCKRLILSTLKQFVKQTLEQPDHPNLNLSPNELITDTLQLLIQMVGDQDISLLPNDEVKVERAEVIDCLVSPLITYCEKSASLLNLNSLSHIRHLDDHLPTNPPDNPSVSIYLANCFNAIQVSLSGVPFTSSQVEQVALKLDNCLNSLVVAQVSFILERTGLLLVNQRLGTVQDPNVPQYTISQLHDMLVDFNNYLSNPDKLCLPDINKLCSQQLRRLVRRRSADQIHSYYQSVHQAIMNVTQTCSESDTTVQLCTPQHVAELILNF